MFPSWTTLTSVSNDGEWQDQCGVHHEPESHIHYDVPNRRIRNKHINWRAGRTDNRSNFGKSKFCKRSWIVLLSAWKERMNEQHIMTWKWSKARRDRCLARQRTLTHLYWRILFEYELFWHNGCRKFPSKDWEALAAFEERSLVNRYCWLHPQHTEKSNKERDIIIRFRLIRKSFA